MRGPWTRWANTAGGGHTGSKGARRTAAVVAATHLIKEVSGLEVATRALHGLRDPSTDRKEAAASREAKLNGRGATAMLVLAVSPSEREKARAAAA